MYSLFLTSTIPPESILTDGKAKKGKNNGIRCGLENLHPESTMLLLTLSKFDATFSNESVEMIPARDRGKSASIFPELVTTNPP